MASTKMKFFETSLQNNCASMTVGQVVVPVQRLNSIHLVKRMYPEMRHFPRCNLADGLLSMSTVLCTT